MTRKATAAADSRGPAKGPRGLKTSCPICGAAVAYAECTETFPFCSPRCRLADLGRWMNERYAVPCSGSAFEEEEGATY